MTSELLAALRFAAVPVSSFSSAFYDGVGVKYFTKLYISCFASSVCICFIQKLILKYCFDIWHFCNVILLITLLLPTEVHPYNF